MTENEQPLTSWKEIAAYLQRAPRTVRRWEAEENLPIHRIQHAVRNSVYAYPSELDEWREGRKPAEDQVDEPEPERIALWGSPLSSFATVTLLLLALLWVGNTSSEFGLAQAQDVVQGAASRLVWSGPNSFNPSFSAQTLRFVSLGNWETVTDPATSRQVTGGLAIRDLQTGDSRQLTWEQDGNRYVDWSVISPDGELVAYMEWNELGPDSEQIHVRNVDGSGERRTLHTASGWSGVVDWTPDGKNVLVVDEVPDNTWRLILISVEDGAVQEIINTGSAGARQARVSPDGRYIAYDLPTVERGWDVRVVSVGGSQDLAIVEHPGNDRRGGRVERRSSLRMTFVRFTPLLG